MPGSGDDVTIAAGTGAYTVTIDSADAAHSITLGTTADTKALLDTASGGTLTLGTTLVNTAGTVELDAGGTLVGGTLSSGGTNGKYNWNGGTWSGGTYNGTLTIGGGQTLLIANGLTATATGAMRAAHPVRAALFEFDDTQTLNNTTITLGNSLLPGRASRKTTPAATQPAR